MHPYLAIREKYVAEIPEGCMTWEQVVGWHLADPLGHVIKGEDFFVMGRAVDSTAPAVDVLDLTHRFEPAACDAWFLFAFAGDKEKAWHALPYELPLLAWQKFHDPELELRFLSAAAIRRLCRSTHGETTSNAGHANHVRAARASDRC